MEEDEQIGIETNNAIIFQNATEPVAPADSMFSWRKTSMNHLAHAESQMLSKVITPLRNVRVKLKSDHEINTLICGTGPPLVLIHGFGAGVGFWVPNLDAFARKHTVYALDLIGFGRSSRPKLKKNMTAEESEDFFLQAIEEWVQILDLKKFFLLGHSLGGYLAGCYALKYPEKLYKVILADPWGIPSKPEGEVVEYSLKFKLILWGANKTSPLAALRMAGPWGKTLIEKVRPDIPYKFAYLFSSGDDDQFDVPPKEVVDYIYHLNAQTPATGEELFWKMVIPVGWPVRALIDRIHSWDKKVPITFIYGNQTWMDPSAADFIKNNILTEEEGYDINIESIFNSGHHVYVDNWLDFNTSVMKATKKERKILKDKEIQKNTNKKKRIKLKRK
eukprot:TRINITY_DN7206_c0_g1_i1.p1 TRINITY_DN7206_c0_g1~~TRINITY_DN7206_c0_g1_i1.p1  ORF type:complete len:435 (-),score=63.63 TRINITY_DN7206_c0_g1_i1:77-1246(-)